MKITQLLIGGGEESTEPAPGTFNEFREVSRVEGGLITCSLAAEILRVSTPAVQDLVNRRKLSKWVFFGKSFVSAREVDLRNNSPRQKGGRPKMQRELQAA